jgi:hypothetical protein
MQERAKNLIHGGLECRCRIRQADHELEVDMVRPEGHLVDVIGCIGLGGSTCRAPSVRADHDWSRAWPWLDPVIVGLGQR